MRFIRQLITTVTTYRLDRIELDRNKIRTLFGIFNFDKSKKMEQEIEKLRNENNELEKKIVSIVGELESFKSEDKIHLKKNMIIRPAADVEAEVAAEKLSELSVQESAPKALSAEHTQLDAKDKGKQKEKVQQNKRASGSSTQPKEDPNRAVDISRLDLRVGKIIECSRHPDADSLYVEKIECGDATGPRTVISGLVNHVPIDEMQNRMVVVLCNLKPAKMRGILSEAMVMCASSADKVEILTPPPDAKPGDRVKFEGFEGEPDAQLNPKKKIWEQVAQDLKTNDEGVAVYKDVPFTVAGAVVKSQSLKGVQVR